MVLKNMPDRADKLVLLVAVENARFRRPVVPGDTPWGPAAAQASVSHIYSLRPCGKIYQGSGVTPTLAETLCVAVESFGH